MSERNLDQELQSYGDSKAKKKSLIGKMATYGAAAAGGLFACSQADADIIHTGPLFGTPGLIPQGSAIGIDLDLDGDLDFGLFHGTVPYFLMNTQVGTNSESGGGFMLGGTTGGYNFPTQLSYGAPISAGATFASGNGWMGWGTSAFYTNPWNVFGNTSSTQTGFVGVQFTGLTASGGQGNVFGWMQFAFHTDGAGLTTWALLDAAYENMGNAINAGDTGNTIPEPTGAVAIAALALGAVGVRRRRKQAA